ncbi:hypothetical protein GIS00_06910 [Nakamurella sp. YIM 132087]|uniref:Uncharacterized protein n=2 Tax=Nakamurella alba TaxID=2665158 RepID=A0A7K1FHS5_9ACTN|nr:hypothetical protein [Nakamurella alba]
MRHEMEERRSKKMRREEAGNGRDGGLKIDLDSGVAVIGPPGEDERQLEAERQANAERRAENARRKAQRKAEAQLRAAAGEQARGTDGADAAKEPEATAARSERPAARRGGPASKAMRSGR